MKKALNLVFAFAMVLSLAFIGDAVASSTNTTNALSAQAQTASVRSNRRVGLTRRVYRGGKYVGRQVWNGTKWVGEKSYKGTKYVGGKAYSGTKYVGKKTVQGTKAGLRKAKNVLY